MQTRIITLIVILLLSFETVTAQQAEPRPHGAEAQAANLDVKTLQALDVAMQKQVDDQHVSGVIGLIARRGKIGKVYGLGGIVDGKGGYSWGGAAGTKFWIDTRSDCYGVFMIQTWGYNPPTYKVFRAHADKAILADKE